MRGNSGVFVLGSTLETLSTNGNTGYLAYLVGWKTKHPTKEGTIYDTASETGFITTSQSGLSNSCFDNSDATATTNIATILTTTGGHTPGTLKPMTAVT